MDETIKAQLVALENEVQTAAVPSDCQRTTLWCIKQLPALYDKFRQTNESRFGEEITRLVQGVMKELTHTKGAGPETSKLAASVSARIQKIHEQFGLPGVEFKTPGAAPSRSRKVG